MDRNVEIRKNKCDWRSTIRATPHRACQGSLIRDDRRRCLMFLNFGHQTNCSLQLQQIRALLSKLFCCTPTVFVHVLRSQQKRQTDTSGSRLWHPRDSPDVAPCDFQAFGRRNLLKPTCYAMYKIGLTFSNCTLCPHCIYVLYLPQNKRRLVPLTA